MATFDDVPRERVAPLAPAERDERQAALVAQSGGELGVFTTLVRHPDLFADFLPFGKRLLERSTLPPRHRELLIMRTAWRCRSPYEWTHHEVIGRKAGLTDDDFAALVVETVETVDADDTSRDPVRPLLLRAADELLAEHILRDGTWQELSERYRVEQTIEICLLVGQYAMLAGALNSLGVQIEDGNPTPPWAIAAPPSG
jgi:4-carboxymuconolactone decarboxylase